MQWQPGRRAPMRSSFFPNITRWASSKKFPLLGAYMGNFLVPFIVRALPPAAADALVGISVPIVWSPLVEPCQQEFVSAYTSAVGMPTDDSDSSPYQGGMAIIKALQATNGDTSPDKLRQALLSVDFEGPEGPVKFDQADHGSRSKWSISPKWSNGATAFVLEPVFTYRGCSACGILRHKKNEVKGLRAERRTKGTQHSVLST